MNFRHSVPRACMVCLMIITASCTKNMSPGTRPAEDSLRIVNDNTRHRAEMDDFFRNDPESPFHRDTTIRYDGIRWFPIDVRFSVQSVLHRYEHPDTVVVFGTKGEKRRELKYGYFAVLLPDDRGGEHPVRINVYKFTPYDSARYALYKDNLSVWFTDRTTGTETYEVGRYIEMGAENHDPSFVYTLDLNKAFNPYCAYSSMYSCAIPREEDHIDIALYVGEKKYHE